MLTDQTLPSSTSPQNLGELVPMDTGELGGKRGGDFSIPDSEPTGKRGRVCSTFLAPIGSVDFDVNEDEEETPTTSDYNFSFRSQDGDFGENELREGRMCKLQAMSDFGVYQSIPLDSLTEEERTTPHQFALGGQMERFFSEIKTCAEASTSRLATKTTSSPAHHF
jgi:hypothetical protein